MNEAAQYAKDISAKRIATGAVLIPLFIGQEPAFAISHPAWHAPAIGAQLGPVFVTEFEPVAQALEKKQIDLFFDEKLTTDTYRRFPGIDKALNENYAVSAEFKNFYGGPIRALRPIAP